MTPLYRAPRTLDDVRAVIYVRQSKRREDDSASSPEAQRMRAEAVIKAKDWKVAGTFADVGVSGWNAKVRRPEFEAMMDAVRAGEVDAVVVFSLSRLTRQGALEAMRINEELDRYGVRLVSVEEPFLDSSTPIGVAIFGLLAALAQQESDLKSSYVSAVKETLRSAGSHVSGAAPYGFQSTRERRGTLTVVKLVPDPVTADNVRTMVKWAAEGMSATMIARQLNEAGIPTWAESARPNAKKRKPVWLASTVLNILRDPRLAGFAAVWEGRTEGGDGKPGSAGKRVIMRDDMGQPVTSHDPIIPAEEWWLLQEVLNGRTKTVRKTGRSVPSLLAGHGMLFCAECGTGMVNDVRAGKLYYRCGRAVSGAVAGHGGLVINSEVTDYEVSARVWARLHTMDPADPEDLEWLAEAARRFAHQQDTSEREKERSAARAELEHVRAALRTVYEDRQAGMYAGETGTAMFRESVERLTAHEARLTERLGEMDTAHNGAIRIPAEWTDPAGDPVGEGSTWAAWDLQTKREFLALFVDDVRVKKAVGRGRNAKTAERIVITWAGSPEA